MDKINPRPIFRKVVDMLLAARCPECNRTFDPVQDAETYLPRQAQLNCSWCMERQFQLHQFRSWQQQDNTIRASRPPFVRRK